MRSQRPVIALAVIAVFALAWAWRPQPQVEVVRASAPAPAITPSTDAAPPRSKPTAHVQSKTVDRDAAPNFPLELLDGRMPLDESVAGLRKFADAGDAEAQAALSSRLSMCTPYGLRASLSQDQRMLAHIEQDKDDPHYTEAQRHERALNIQWRVDQDAAQRAACTRIPADLIAHWLDPLEHAAQSGDTYAMRQFARSVISRYDTVTAVVADVDAAIADRDKARAYMLEAATYGDRRGVVDLAYAYLESFDGTPGPFAVDPFQAYAYAYAGVLAGASEHGELEGLMMRGSKPLSSQLTTQQLAAAQAQGRRIYEQCCAPR